MIPQINVTGNSLMVKIEICMNFSCNFYLFQYNTGALNEKVCQKFAQSLEKDRLQGIM